ncbi:hypothetical protein OfM1_05340 [Lactovum odontotermitis]
MFKLAQSTRAEIRKKGFFFPKYYYRLWTTKTNFYDFETTAEDWNENLALSAKEPVCYGQIEERFYWYFKGEWCWENERLSADEVRVKLYLRHNSNQREIERGKEMIAAEDRRKATKRTEISDEVRQLVWERDKGRCVRCGSKENLMFDYIIPLTMGGASTAENMQVLCVTCSSKRIEYR